MPTLHLYPNDSRDYTGHTYNFDAVFDKWRAIKEGGVSDKAETIQQEKHIKIDTGKDIRGVKGKHIEKGLKEEKGTGIVGKEAHTTINTQINTETTNTIDGEGDKGGDEKSFSLFDYNQDGKIDSSDLSNAGYDAGNKVFSMTKSGVNKVGEGYEAFVEKSSRATARGMAEGLDLDRRISEIESRFKHDLDKKYESARKSAEGIAQTTAEDITEDSRKIRDEITITAETMRNASYLAVGVVFAYLLLKK